jgi:hypothetical protein
VAGPYGANGRDGEARGAVYAEIGELNLGSAMAAMAPPLQLHLAGLGVVGGKSSTDGGGRQRCSHHAGEAVPALLLARGEAAAKLQLARVPALPRGSGCSHARRQGPGGAAAACAHARWRCETKLTSRAHMAVRGAAGPGCRRGPGVPRRQMW